MEKFGIKRVNEIVGVKPTSDRFNQFYKLDLLNAKKPLNPYINLGAIGVTGLFENPILDLQEIFYKILKENIFVNEEVFNSENETGFRNYSMAYMLKEIGIIRGDAEETVKNYFKACSLEMDLNSLNKISYPLANEGRNYNGDKIFTKETTKIINSTMAISGMYDGSGEFQRDIGLPGKSAVSGAIIAIKPREMAISSYSPGLDEMGNSLKSLKTLEELSKELDLSVY